VGVTNYLLVADAGEAESVVAHDDPPREWGGFHYRGLDRIKLVALWSLIEAGSTDDRFEQRMHAVRTIPEGDQGPWVDLAPTEMVSALASLAPMTQEEVTKLAEVLRRMEDFQGWEEAEVVELVRAVGDQAETASLEGKTLMIYSCL
jgi:hypothetical protein